MSMKQIAVDGAGHLTLRMPPTGPRFQIMSADGRPLLTIERDGTVTGEIEDASEAAAVFIRTLRTLIPLPAEFEKHREDDMFVGGFHLPQWPFNTWSCNQEGAYVHTDGPCNV